MDTAKPAFEGAALTKFLEPFVTPKAQQAAVEALEKQGRLNAQAFFYHARVVDRNRPVQTLDFTPPSSKAVNTVAQAKERRITDSHTKMLLRVARIERAYNNRIDQIKAKQTMELRVKQSLGGQTLSQVFKTQVLKR